MHETSCIDGKSLRDVPDGIWLWASAVQLDYDLFTESLLDFPGESHRRYTLQYNALLHLSRWPLLESVTLNIRDKFGEDPSSSCLTYDRFRDLLDLRSKAMTALDDPIPVGLGLMDYSQFYYQFLDAPKTASRDTALSHVKREMDNTGAH